MSSEQPERSPAALTETHYHLNIIWLSSVVETQERPNMVRVSQSLMTVILKTALRGPRQLSPHAQCELTNKNIRPLEQSTGKVSPGSIRAFKQRHQASRTINGEGLGGLNTSPRAKTSGHSNSPRSSVGAIRALKSAITLTDRCSRHRRFLCNRAGSLNLQTGAHKYRRCSRNRYGFRHLQRIFGLNSVLRLQTSR